jgi:hypothetical protein
MCVCNPLHSQRVGKLTAVSGGVNAWPTPTPGMECPLGVCRHQRPKNVQSQAKLWRIRLVFVQKRSESTVRSG